MCTHVLIILCYNNFVILAEIGLKPINSVTNFCVYEERVRLIKKIRCLKALGAYKVNFDIDVNISGYH